MSTDRADAPEYCVSGLQRDSKYLFRVCAKNRVGSGPLSSTEEAVQAKNKFERGAGRGEPLRCHSVLGAPLKDGGSEITNYVIELRDRTSVKWEAAMVCAAVDRSAKLNDVVENKEYIFRVRAENKAGIGRPSAATSP
ncbi:hypothetical protein KUCAC02_022145 [Chaenocephalus aceratus]|nr:hypothetical protein KUCAC02_022145 [Chaenocephalus aceratus]